MVRKDLFTNPMLLSLLGSLWPFLGCRLSAFNLATSRMVSVVDAFFQCTVQASRSHLVVAQIVLLSYPLLLLNFIFLSSFDEWSNDLIQNSIVLVEW